MPTGDDKFRLNIGSFREPPENGRGASEEPHEEVAPVSATSVMRYCAACGTRYSASARFCPNDGAVLRDEGSGEDWLIGALVADRYIVERKLGEGGMGVVYLATHRRMNRKCALKVLRPEAIAIPEAVSRFAREAENASRVQHPNIAMVFDCASVGDELMYIAMEYIEGESLNALLAREAPLAVARTARILSQAASALRAAHELGIVHRDMKPDNLMIARSPSGDESVKVVDFGIARAVMRDSQRLTTSGVMIGTPAYMAPEQLMGEAIDSRTDQYSLALIVYRMLTGTLPFPTGKGSDYSARLVRPPSRLSDLSPTTDWPDALQEVLDRGLAVDPNDRFENVQHFARGVLNALHEWQPGEFESTSSLELDPVGAHLRSDRRTPSSPVGVKPVESRSTPAAQLVPEMAEMLDASLVNTVKGSRRLKGAITLAALSLVGFMAFRVSSADGSKTPNRQVVAPSESPGTLSVDRNTVGGVGAAPVVTGSRAEATKKPSGVNNVPKDKSITAKPAQPRDSSPQLNTLLQGQTVPTPGPVIPAVDSSVLPSTPPPTLEPTRPEPEPDSGTIRIATIAEAASLYINGTLRGVLRTRIQELRVPKGEVTLRLRAEGCQDWDTTVNVPRGKSIAVGRRAPRC